MLSTISSRSWLLKTYIFTCFTGENHVLLTNTSCLLIITSCFFVKTSPFLLLQPIMPWFLELCPGISGRRMPKDLSPLEPAVFSSEHLLENRRKTWLGLNWMTTLVNPFFGGCGKNHKKYLGWSWTGLNDSHYTSST